MPTTYRKMIVTKLSPNFGEAIQIIEAPLPEPGRGEILVRTRYAGMNASVGVFTAGGYPNTPPLPFDVSTESTGEVVAVGENVTHLKAGDTVMGFGAGFSEYQLVKAPSVYPVTQASPEITSFLVSGLTASIALEQVGEMKSGETVLVTAAAGGTGQFAVQLAKLAGNHVIGTCSSDEKAALLKELGCDRVINYRREDLGKTLKEEYPKGVNLVYESVGRSTFDICMRNLAIRGRMLVIGSVADYTAGPETITAPRINSSLVMKSISLRGFFLFHFTQYYAAHLQKLSELYREGKLKVNIEPTEFKGIDSVVKAFEFLHSGKSSGKVIVSF
ncbi:MAG: zinc-binding dehydrogenase [Chloroflexi bacterium]|uniref:Zinc-binding dehydrogenase n=1 Tax=Candidatus Chlorohelix allophototropha TaxID=3003348 RepID=A0A8T7M080_9CHLR|nr:zinc-binding dehydrogenase [Chloroflexota bacterium]WJW67922.1 zinc-binding dehydrogenase [Chloroflexota bacterium L227-S17]